MEKLTVELVAAKDEAQAKKALAKELAVYEAEIIKIKNKVEKAYSKVFKSVSGKQLSLNKLFTGTMKAFDNVEGNLSFASEILTEHASENQKLVARPKKKK